LKGIEIAADCFLSNFSVGVNALFWLTRRTAEMLGKFRSRNCGNASPPEKDAPMTPQRNGRILCAVRKLNYAENVAHGREGLIGERPAAEIGIHSIRGGDVIGDHTVTFAGRGERLELTHKASSREAFATGALRAARWIVGRSPGFYTMEDVWATADK
jgi:4-hydroxy-tetrahydrodipicolinate reductase